VTSNVQRILVATDFSAQAERAARRALALAPAGATVHLLHVLPAAPLQRIREVLGTPVDAQVREAALGEAEHRLEELRARLTGELGRTLTAEVVEGRPKTAISDYAREHAFDLVVAGTHGREGIQQVFSGNTAQKVVRTADRPVLLVGAVKGADRPYRRVLVAVDFSEASGRALHWALALSPEATVYVLHVFELPFEQIIDYQAVDREVAEHYREKGQDLARAELDRLLASTQETARCRPLIRQGEPARVILGQARYQEVDLIAMGSRGLGAGSESLLGSVNVHLMQRAECDLLSIRP